MEVKFLTEINLKHNMIKNVLLILFYDAQMIKFTSTYERARFL